MANEPPKPSMNYRLHGTYPYGIYFSPDGEDYKFPILDPLRIDKIHDRLKFDGVQTATTGQWLDVDIVEAQRTGYHTWVPTDNFILHMHPQFSLPDDKYAYVGRFSYESESQELLMGRLDSKHAATIKQFGRYVFNKYLRGIYLRDRRLILIKAYFNPLDERGVFHDEFEFDPEIDMQKTQKTLEMLVKNNLPRDISIIARVDNEVLKQFETIHI